MTSLVNMSDHDISRVTFIQYFDFSKFIYLIFQAKLGLINISRSKVREVRTNADVIKVHGCISRAALGD